jgi:DnaD/phage-associated family protein
MVFKGFSSGKVHLTPIPGKFFSELLPTIDHLGELKLTLYFFWRLERMVGDFRYLRRSDFAQDELFMQGLSPEPAEAQAFLDEAMQRAVRRGTLLAAQAPGEESSENLYFLNSPKGRAAVEAIQQGQWRPTGEEELPAALTPAPPNIFRLYEEHIGPLTPMIAEALGEAEDTYPASWIEEAFRIAVERNARNWRYIEAILKRWQEEGRHAQEDRRDTEKAGRKYIEGEFSDYIKH